MQLANLNLRSCVEKPNFRRSKKHIDDKCRLTQDYDRGVDLTALLRGPANSSSTPTRHPNRHATFLRPWSQSSLMGAENPFIRRAAPLYDLWHSRYVLEVLCYTPDEWRKLKDKQGILLNPQQERIRLL